MKHDMDRLLKHALSPDIRPDARLDQNILKEAEEMILMRRKKRSRIPAAVFAACCILILGSTTAFAAWKMLNPVQVAEHHRDAILAEAFQSEGAILVNETQESGGYKVTLLGAVAGKNLSQYLVTDDSGVVQDDRFYSVVAIARTDGTPMPDTSSDEYGKDPFYVSPYIKGLNPALYSLMSMGGGYSEFVQDGVQYRLTEMDNIEIFADRGIYMGVSSGVFYDMDAYRFDETTGEITRNESYQGVNALFVLPMDPSKADPQAAQAYLDAMNESQEPYTIEQDEQDRIIKTWVNNLTRENLDEYCEIVEGTEQICKPDAQGMCTYNYDLGDGDTGGGQFSFYETFPEGTPPGSVQVTEYSYSEDGMASLEVGIVTLREDGTVSWALYRPIPEQLVPVDY